MLNLTPQTREVLEERYMFANTPGYILRHFREAPAVKQLATSHSIAQLVAVVTAVEGKPSPSIEDIVDGYSAIVALTYFENVDLKAIAAAFPNRKLVWATKILTNWINQNLTKTAQIYTKPEPNISITTYSGSSVAVSLLELPAPRNIRITQR
jgi:hypothetical protein